MTYIYTKRNEKVVGNLDNTGFMLEEDDDVQNVWHNAEFPDGWEG